MKFLPKTEFLAGFALAFATLMPRAEAAYLDAASWTAALSGAVAQYGEVTLAGLPGYSVTFQDAYGTWTPETRLDPVYVGPDANPYNTSGVTSRGFSTPLQASAGEIGAIFTCHSFYFPCLGNYRATFKLPYEIIGLTGSLQIGADYWPSMGESLFPELEIGNIIAGVEWKYPGRSFFYGQLFDAPTDTFTVSWTGDAQTNLDAFAHFVLSDTLVVIAPVPEPASVALFGMGLLGLGLVRRRPARRQG